VTDFLERYGQFLLAATVGVFALVAAYRQSKRSATNPNRPKSVLDYLLVWPLFFGGNAKTNRSKGLFTVRELFGWIIVVALIAVGMAFF
jgi:hypothetical protein